MKVFLNLKKKICIFISVIMIISALPISAFSLNEAGEYCSQPETYEKSDSGIITVEEMKEYFDVDALRAYLKEQFLLGNTTIDISMFKVPCNDTVKSNLYNLIYYTPEFFNISMYSYSYTIGSDPIITKLYPTYKFSAEEYAYRLSFCENEAQKLLSGIIGNSSLSEMEKALLLHDRIVSYLSYDLNYEDESYNMYGALSNHKAVCDGYTRVYAYLLDKVGIKNYHCRSSELHHAWNIVYIDNVPYHVDTTWDDPYYDVTGRVKHQNFLRSTEGIYSTGHEASDYDSYPVDTKYDNYFWQNSTASFELVDGRIYFIDNEAATLNYISGDSTVTVAGLKDTWYANSNGYYWRSNYSKLTSDGTSLLYSLTKGVYKYDTATGKSELVYSPDLSIGDSFSIFGLKYEDGYLIIDRSNTPNFTATTKETYGIKVPYDKTAPVVSASATNDFSEEQTVTLTMSDNVSIAGYYFGKNSDYSYNTFTSASSNTASISISEPGTYYFTAIDGAGNASETKSVTFFKTVFNANGGTVTSGGVLTPQGCSFTFPTAVRDGYELVGWAASASQSEGVTSLTPYKNSIYYAIWREIPVVLTSVSLVSAPSKTAYYVGDRLDTSGLVLNLTYSNGKSENITSGFTADCDVLRSAGTTCVNVYYGDKTVSFNVYVSSPSIVLSASSNITLLKNESIEVNATTVPCDLAVTWTTSDTAVACVSDGIITAKACGTATVTASFTYNGYVYIDSITVNVLAETTDIVKSVFYDINEDTGKITFTVITSPADINRIKIALASDKSSYIKYASSYTLNSDGDCVWTMTAAAPTETTDYVIDARSNVTGSYFSDYYSFTVEIIKPQPIMRAVCVKSYSGKLIFTVITSSDINRVKVSDESNPAGYIKYTNSYTLLSDGSYQWTVEVPAPSYDTRFFVDGRLASDNKYLKEYLEYDYVAPRTIISVDHTVIEGKIYFSVTTGEGFNRVKVADPSNLSGSLGVGSTPVDNGDGTFTWLIKIADTNTAAVFAFDARYTASNTYAKEYYMYNYTPDVKIISAEHRVEAGKIYFYVTTPNTFDRVKLAYADNPSKALTTSYESVVNSDGTITWTIKYNAPTVETDFCFDVRSAETGKYSKDYLDYTFTPDVKIISAEHKVEAGKIYFYVTTPNTFDRVKLAYADTPSKAITTSYASVVNSDGTVTWTIKYNAPTTRTAFCFDVRNAQTGAYTKEYYEYVYTPDVTIISVEHRVEAGKIYFYVTTPNTFDRVKLAYADNPSKAITTSYESVVNSDGTITWTVKYTAPTESTAFCFDARNASTGSYAKDYYEYAVALGI